MGFRGILLFLFLLINLFAYLALRQAVYYWAPASKRRRVLWGVNLAVVALNLPLCAFFIRRFDLALLWIPTWVLEVLFYPATAWLATIIAFFVLVGPLSAIAALARGVRWAWRSASRLARSPDQRSLAPNPDKASLSGAPTQVPAAQISTPGTFAISRRGFIRGSVGMLIPAMYGVADYGAYDSLDDLDVSPEIAIPIPHLPRSLDGMTIVQVTDLHVGPYIRERELQHLVSVINELRPDIVAITGDILDRHLSSLPETVHGLAGLKPSLASYAVLGNHDIYADQYSFNAHHRGGVKIAKGMEEAGIRTLRNEVVMLGEGSERLALLGLDWLSADPSSPSFYSYKDVETRRELAAMTASLSPETPKVLLAHHPDSFTDAKPLGIGLTLSGHTHGGGQVLVGHLNGVPLGIGLIRFKYLSGLYEEQGLSCYVNRGIGYLGVPIRINCPPEVSRFRLTRPAST